MGSFKLDRLGTKRRQEEQDGASGGTVFLFVAPFFCPSKRPPRPGYTRDWGPDIYV